MTAPGLMRVTFTVYGSSSDELYEHARGALADFGPGIDWAIDFDVRRTAPTLDQPIPGWAASVTATRRTP